MADRLLKRYKAAQTEKANAEAKGDDKAAKAAGDTLDALVLFKGRHGGLRAPLYAFLSRSSTTATRAIEKRFVFFKRLLPLLEFGRERPGGPVQGRADPPYAERAAASSP